MAQLDGDGVALPAGRDGPPGGPPPAPRTYREYYVDQRNNPVPERVAGYLAGYKFADVGGGDIPTPAALKDQTVALSDRQPMTFLCMVPGPEGTIGEVTILHRFLRYVDAPGDDPSGYHDRVLGLLGDILPRQYPVVEVPGSAFHLVGTPVRVPTVAAMNALLPTWEDPSVALGPYTVQDPETEVVRPRHIQLVPGHLAAMLIHRRRVNAKVAYQELLGAIQAMDALDTHNDVIIWLRAACTARGGGGVQNTTPSVIQSFVPLHLPPEVYSYVTSKVENDLPALANAGGEAGVQTEAFAGAIRALVSTRRTGGGTEEGDDEAKLPRSIAETYRETYRTLLRFCNVASVDEVAPFWARLARCHKSEQHTVMSQEFQRVCMARGLSTEIYVPIVTTILKQMVVSFQFAGHGPDDLASGCQPFMVSYAGEDNHYEALAAASVSNQLAQGEQNASLADWRSLRDQEKVKFPRDIGDVCITMYRFAVLCQVLFQGLGDPHPLVEAMWATARGFQNLAPFITARYQSLSRTPGVSPTYYARALRAIQLGVHEFMQQVSVNVVEGVTGVEVPTFTTMLQELKRGTFHQSTNWIAIPDAYMDAWPATGSSPGSHSGRSIPSGTSTSSSTVRTGVSSLTQEASRESVARVTNPTSDPEFTTLTLRAGGSRGILREHPPPTNDAGQEFCVAWWTKGGCFPNCRRRSTHAPFASPAERTRLLAYVREHLVVAT